MKIAGVLIADYWLVRDRKLALGDLYRTKGVYTYANGWNWRAVVATLIGCGLAAVECTQRVLGSFDDRRGPVELSAGVGVHGVVEVRGTDRCPVLVVLGVGEERDAVGDLGAILQRGH